MAAPLPFPPADDRITPDILTASATGHPVTVRRASGGRGFWFGLLLLFLTRGLVGLAADAPLRRIADIKARGNSPAAAGTPVQLEGVVTTFREYLFTVQDDSGAIYVDPAGVSRDLRVGQRVAIEGRTEVGGFAPKVTPTRVTVLGPGKMPAARTITWDHLLTGREDNTWVEVSGIVKQVTPQPGAVRLTVEAIEGLFQVWCARPDSAPEPPPLEDADVRIQGVYQVNFNTAGQLTGFQLQVPGFEYVHVDRPPPPDPFALPVRTIDSLLRFNPEGGSGHRLRLQGRVIYHQPGDALFIQDETSTLRAETEETAPLTPGDLVTVVGFPDRGTQRPILQSARIRKLGPGPDPQPARLANADAVTALHHFELIHLDATLMGVARTARELVLTLESGHRIFSASLRDPELSLGDLLPGSRLGVTGICLGDFDGEHNIRSFSLLLRRSADITVLQQPSWWTLSRVLLLAALLAAVAGVGLAWGASLRTRVNVQTVELRTQLERETELEQRYRTLAESSPVGICQTNPEGESVYANPAMCRQLGLKAAAGSERFRLADLLRPVAPAGPAAAGTPRAGSDGSAPAGYEAEVVDHEGRRRQLMVTTAPLLRADGEQHGAIHTCVDVSDERRFAAEVVAARDAALAASRAKSEFLATMSHEIRTPMNGILGMTELLQESRLDPHQQELADTIAKSGDALLHIINDILDLSRIEAGRMTLVEAEFELPPLVDGVVTLLEQSRHGKPVTVRAEFEEDLPQRFRGDGGRLRQVLLNLLGNGLKFTAHGSVTARVRQLSRDDGKSRLRFEVTDTGIGIPAEKCALLFQPFQQVDSSMTRQHGGTGLGLVISRRMIELMGGQMGMTSTVGQGSTFWFEITLPVVDSASPPAMDGNPPPGRLSVLVAHDHELKRRLSLLYLEKLGCQAEFVGSGQELLDRLRTTRCDAVLFDLALPDLDGCALASAIRGRERQAALPGRPPLRLVAILKHETALDRERLRACGIDAIVDDPPSISRLRQALFAHASATAPAAPITART